MDELTNDTRLSVLAAEISIIRAQAQQTLITASIEIGRRLTEARGRIPHGHFRAWLENHTEFTERHAQKLMQIFETYGKQPIEGAEKLTFSKAVALLSAPDEMREDMIASGEAEQMSVRELRAEIDARKQEIAEKQLTIDQMIAESEDRKQALENLTQQAKDALARANSESSRRNESDAARLDAEKARNEAQRERDSLRDKIKELRDELDAEIARKQEPVIQQVEIVPEEVSEELERLRDQVKRAPDETTIKIREAYARILKEFEFIVEKLPEMGESEQKKYGAAFAAGLKKMAARFGGEA